MELKFQGLNIFKHKIENKYLKIIKDEENLNHFYVTIDSIYYLANDENSSKNTIYIFDHEKNQFLKLNSLFDNKNINIISISTNSSDIWVLISLGLNESKSNVLELLKFNQNILTDRININNEIFNCQLNSLVLVASDINVYIFDNNQDDGLKCIYQLKVLSNLTKKDSENEKRLNENPISSLPLNQVLISERIKQFTSGKEHVLMLTEKTNKVYSFGVGLKGQLGHNVIENLFKPKEITFFKTKILKVEAGGWHSGAIDENGNIFLWGWNAEGQIGIEDSSSFIINPTKLDIRNEFTDEQVKFKTLSLGTRHSMLIDNDNNLYAFGWNKYGQLFKDTKENDYCLNPETNIEEPLKCVFFNKITLDVKCSNFFSLILINKNDI